ncbi:flagellum-associated coiled-coil domain-containing protein 1-like isoform X1 [Heptranchias perlo]|uniref:flagellum-associated coiled-coil domain-containing protein 1-like isoform X1 n=1 Tax=Heptranchias perlo TaxID=212740 RepID=UPI00355A38BB
MNSLCGPPTPRSGTECTTLELCGKCEKGKTFQQHYKLGESVVIAPGYVLSRNKSNVTVSLCDEFFNRIHPPNTYVPRSALENNNEQLVTDLQKQITQLVQLLEEESHKQMSIENRFQIKGKEETLEIQRKHQAELSKLEEINALEIEELQNSFEDLMEEQKDAAEKQYNELKTQLENSQAAFMSYKETIIEEMNESWSQKETEMKEKYETEKRMELVLQKNSMQNRCDQEKRLMEEGFQEQIISVVDEHKKELEEASEKYEAVLMVAAEQKKLKLELMDLQNKLEKMTETLRNQTQYLNHVEAQLEYNKAKLSEIEGTYMADVSGMHKKYVASIDSLEAQNIDLKQLFALKAEELCALKAAIEEQERLQQIEMKESLQVTLEEGSMPPLTVVETTNRSMADTLHSASPPASQTEVNKPED